MCIKQKLSLIQKQMTETDFLTIITEPLHINGSISINSSFTPKDWVKKILSSAEFVLILQIEHCEPPQKKV